MKISCIIPTCDRKEFLAEAINSVLAQTLEPFEIIIVNNGKDKADFPESIKEKVKVYNTESYIGVSRARNFGAEKAQGDYLAFLDDDDLWSKTYLENVSTAIKNGAECVISRIDQWSDGKAIKWKNPQGKITIENLLTFNPGVQGSNLVVSREVFLRLGKFDTNLITSEDKSLLIKLIQNNVNIKILPDNQALWRVHQVGRLTDSDKLALGKFQFLKKHSDLMTKKQYFFNLSKIYYHKYKSGKKLSVFGYIFFKLMYYFFSVFNFGKN